MPVTLLYDVNIQIMTSVSIYQAIVTAIIRLSSHTTWHCSSYSSILQLIDQSTQMSRYRITSA